MAGIVALTGTPATSRAQQFCLPCSVPCTPDSCNPPKAAAAPAPKPVPPTPPPAPAAAATFEPAPGPFTGPQAIALTTTTPNAVIHYTTDGSDPTDASPVYSAPIPVAATTTIKTITIAPGAPESPVASGTYTITPPPPSRVEVTKERLQLKEKVFFDTGKTAIDPASYGLLDEVAMALKEHPEVKRVAIEGHTDNRGSPAMNAKLSKGRAEAVRTYLVQKGVEPGRLDARGFGPTRPIADNKTAKGREANRRVDFVVVEPAPGS